VRPAEFQFRQAFKISLITEKQNNSTNPL